MNNDWEIHATPYFSKARCPKHHNEMKQLDNGFFGNPVWWCKQCGYPYELKFTKMKQWNREEVKKQLEGEK